MFPKMCAIQILQSCLYINQWILPKYTLLWLIFSINCIGTGCTGSWSPQPTLIEREDGVNSSWKTQDTPKRSSKADLKTATPLSNQLGLSKKKRSGKAQNLKEYITALTEGETLVSLTFHLNGISSPNHQIQCTLRAHEINASLLSKLNQHSLPLMRIYSRLWASFRSPIHFDTVFSNHPPHHIRPLHPHTLAPGDLIYIPYKKTSQVIDHQRNPSELQDEIILIEKPITWLREGAYHLGSCTPLDTLHSLTRLPVYAKAHPAQNINLEMKSVRWNTK